MLYIHTCILYITLRLCPYNSLLVHAVNWEFIIVEILMIT